LGGLGFIQSVVVGFELYLSIDERWCEKYEGGFFVDIKTMAIISRLAQQSYI